MATNHLFTVNAEGKQVIFSPGNLYWDGSKFAEETDALGYTTVWNPNHVDRFYWSKDAAIARAEIYRDPSVSKSDKFFAADGGAIAGKTVLSRDEWKYLLNTRPNASNLYRIDVLIAGGRYLVFAPDDFTGTIPAEMTGANWGEYSTYYGLVALAAAGSRNGSEVYGVGGIGYYWSSTAGDERHAYIVSFDSYDVGPDYNDLCDDGYSIRLVQVYEEEPPKLFHKDLVATLRDWIKSKFYIKPTSGIPKSDLVSEVQSSLDRADTSISDALSDNKTYGRKNGAWTEVEGGTNDAVKYTEQILTDSQKAQARANIGITIYNGEVI